MVNLFPLIPLIIAILFAIKVTIIYLLAVYYDHVNPIYPYLSDAGTSHPEAGFFSMLLILSGILTGIFGWIRFKQIRYIVSTNSEFNSNNNNKTLNETQIKRIHKFNKYGLYSAIMGMLGMGGVAAFRSSEHVELHVALGANLAFLGGLLYYAIQTWFSYKLIPIANTKRMAHFRLFITIFALIMGLIMSIAFILSWALLKVPFYQMYSPTRLKWDESFGGYEAHYISAITENLMIISVTPFFLSFYTEFKRINSKNGKLKFNFIGQSNTEIIAV